MQRIHFLLLCLLSGSFLQVAGQPTATITVSGTHIIGPCGDTLLLRGVNYAPYNWGYDDTQLNIAAIATTGANCVRLPWYKNNPSAMAQETYSNYTLLDSALSKCIQGGLVPVLELHDLTCQNDAAALEELATWYTEPAILSLIDKYKNSLILNIANEALHINWTSNPTASKATFINTYSEIVTNLRDEGITVPIMIDGSECGNNLMTLADMAAEIQEADPLSRLIFSAHAYWYGYDAMDSTTARNMIEYAEGKNIPFIIGEVANLQDDATPCQYTLNYKPVLNMLQEKNIGWLAWSWDNDVCPLRQITTAGSATSLTTFGNDIFNNTAYGLNAHPPARSKVLSASGCGTTSMVKTLPEISTRVFPNPAHSVIYVQSSQASAISSIQLTDLTGRKQEISVRDEKQQQYVISLPKGIAPGIYLLRFKVNGYDQVNKVTIR